MSFWDHDNLRAAARGTWVARPDVGEILGAGIDSRTIVPGQIFFALTGEHTDGCRFLGQAQANGSPLAIVGPGEVEVPEGMGVLRVVCVREALVRLASAYRAHRTGLKVIAVTGSCGKTTTVRLIDAVLKQGLTGSASVRSFNNDIGVPLTLLNSSPGDQYVVCEVGTSGPGEIERLARVCDPDIAVITSIGRAHLEGLGSIEAVACEKAQLVVNMRETGFAALPMNAPLLEPFVRGVPGERLVRVGEDQGADVRVCEIVSDLDGTGFGINGRERYRVGLVGAHNAVNAAFAVVVARRLGVGESEIASGLLEAVGPKMRLEVGRAGTVTVINDAYNANPDSMVAALRTLAGFSGGRKVAVIGDMLELGSVSEAEHEALGAWIDREQPAEVVIGVGAHAGAMASGLTHRFEQADEKAVGRIVEMIEPGDIVLVKGSRAVALERVVEGLMRRFGSEAEMEAQRSSR
jgi:UDP-N-acetylmuramoyl-tripeptide--D-alanyl-D-alanine ligase